jgi:hypothetical protein
MRYRPRLELKRTRKICIPVNDDEWMAIHLIALERNQTMTNYILKAINEKLKREGLKED